VSTIDWPISNYELSKLLGLVHEIWGHHTSFFLTGSDYSHRQ